MRISASAKSKFSTGEIINIQSADPARIGFMVNFLHMVLRKAYKIYIIILQLKKPNYGLEFAYLDLNILPIMGHFGRRCNREKHKKYKFNSLLDLECSHLDYCGILFVVGLFRSSYAGWYWRDGYFTSCEWTHYAVLFLSFPFLILFFFLFSLFLFPFWERVLVSAWRFYFMWRRIVRYFFLPPF
jgi:hypothetical protein